MSNSLDDMAVPGNFMARLDKIERQLNIMNRNDFVMRSVGEVTDDLGLVQNGEFRCGNGVEPGDGFSGVRICYPPVAYGTLNYNIAGVNNDGLTFGINADTGRAEFAGGAGIIDQDYIKMTGIQYAIRGYATAGASERYGYLGMQITPGGTTPVWGIGIYAPAGTELVVNGGFESGTANWTKTTETNGSWSISNTHMSSGTACMAWVSTNATNTGVLTSDLMAVNASSPHLVSCKHMVVLLSGGNQKAELKWYTAGTVLISTDTIYSQNSSDGAVYTASTLNTISPSTAAFAKLVVTLTNTIVKGGATCFIDDFSLSQVTVSESLYLDNSGDLTYTNGMFPKRGGVFFNESIASTALAFTAYSDQPYNGAWSQASAGDGDNFTIGMMLEKGTYTLSTLGVTYNNTGKVDYLLDGVSIATGQDWYSAGATYDVTKTVSSVAVAYSGWHVLKLTVNTKNGSSSGYKLILTKIWMTQAAD